MFPMESALWALAFTLLPWPERQKAELWESQKAGLDAGGADPHAPGHAVQEGADPLDIGIPTAFGDVVGVGNIVPKLGLFTADFALTGHGNLTNSNSARAKEEPV